MAVGNSLTKLSKGMGIADLIKAMEPEIKKALPSFMTPERFTRMALSATNMSPDLLKCDQVTFLSALMSAAQLGLEPNTPLGQAYLIPFRNHGKLECQFQIGYKGYRDLFYRNEKSTMLDAHCVYENDSFEYEFGLEPVLKHKPALKNRGEMIAAYAVWKTNGGGFGFEVMSKEDIDAHAKKYSQSYSSSYSPWSKNFESMAKKTVIKQALKYAPISTDILRLVSNDETIKTEIAVDMSEVMDQTEPEGVVSDQEYREVPEEQEVQADAQHNSATVETEESVQQSFFN